MIATDSQMCSTRSSWWLENSDGDPGPGPLGQDLGHVVDAARVQAGEGLVEDEQFRVVHQRGGQLHPLLVAVRERLQLGRLPAGQAQPLDPVPRGVARRGRRHVVQPAQVLQLLQDLHARVEAAFLGHVAEPAPVLLGHRLALPAHLARLQRHHAEDRAHRGGLAGPVRPQEAEDLAGRDAEGQAVQRDHGPEPAAQPDQLERHLAAGRLRAGRRGRRGHRASIPVLVGPRASPLKKVISQ